MSQLSPTAVTQEFGPALHVQPVFLFPTLACRSQAQHPPEHPPLATRLWQAGLLLCAACKLQLGGRTCGLSCLPLPWGMGSLAETVPLMQSVLCAQHHAGRAGSSLSTTTGHSYQPLGHRGSSELAVVSPRQGGSYRQDGGCLSEAVPTPMFEAFKSSEVCVCVCVCITRSCQGDLFLFSIFFLPLHPLQSSPQHQDPTAWVLPIP